MEIIDFEKETLNVLNPPKKKKKYNTFLAGAFAGFIAPFISIFIIYLIFSPANFTFTDFINQTRYLKLTSPVLSLCVLPNLLLFFICLWTERLLTARGVVFATMVYAFVVVVIKFLI